MGWGPKKAIIPDTTAQEAELRRQTDLLMQQFQAFMAQSQTQFSDQRAADQVRFDQQRAADLAEAERQRGILQTQADEQRQLLTDANAATAAERARVQQQADARAATARQYSDGRNSLLDQIVGAVDSTYAGFDDNYFRTFSDAVVAAGKPALTEKYDRDRRSTRFALSDVGNLNSSAAARVMKDLQLALKSSEADLASRASGASTELRDQIEGQKRTALSGLINSAFVGNEDLPDGVTDASGALGQISGRLNSYLADLQQQVRNYVPMAGSTALSAPRVNAAQVSLPTLSTGNLTGPITSDVQSTTPRVVV